MSATRQPRVRDRRPGQAARSWVGRNVTRRQSQAGQQPAHVAEPRARGRRDLGPDVDQGRTHCSVVAAASSGASRLARSRPERSLLAAIPALICDPSQQWRTWNSEGRYRPSRLSAVLVVTLARVGWPCRISRPSGAQISSVTGSERNGQHRFSGCDEQPLRFPAGAGSVSSPGESSRPATAEWSRTQAELLERVSDPLERPAAIYWIANLLAAGSVSAPAWRHHHWFHTRRTEVTAAGWSFRRARRWRGSRRLVRLGGHSVRRPVR